MVIKDRFSALQSAAKSNKSCYHSKIFVCVSVIRGVGCSRSVFDYLNEEVLNQG